jgi:Xaa-Pro dipeptidase
MPQAPTDAIPTETEKARTVKFPADTVFDMAQIRLSLVRVRNAMDERGLDVLLIHSLSNIYYLTDRHSVNLWDYQCVIVPRYGDLLFVLWEFEPGRFAASCTGGIIAQSYSLSSDPVPATIDVCYRCGLQHSTHCRAPISRGETVFLEMVGCRHWYNAPLTRMAVVGQTTTPVARLAEVGRVVASVMMERMRPGVAVSGVARAGANAMATVWQQVFFHDTFGSPVGIGLPPSWLEDRGFLITTTNQKPLLTGMAFNLPFCFASSASVGLALASL